jgi:hypothetical protein
MHDKVVRTFAPLAIEVGASYLGSTINPVNEVMFQTNIAHDLYF